jgi:hypothetical protein
MWVIFAHPNPDEAGGSPLLTIIIMLFSGAQLLTLGLVGEYLGRFCLAINMMPQAVVRKTWGLGAPASGGDDA